MKLTEQEIRALRAPKPWHKGGYLEEGYEITYHDAKGLKQCTFVGVFDGNNAFRLRLHHREPYGSVPKTRKIYLADIETKSESRQTEDGRT